TDYGYKDYNDYEDEVYGYDDYTLYSETSLEINASSLSILEEPNIVIFESNAASPSIPETDTILSKKLSP
ncbi:38857_t:CDS:1, partial [Gigaspora margarita]